MKLSSLVYSDRNYCSPNDEKWKFRNVDNTRMMITRITNKYVAVWGEVCGVMC